MGNRVTSDATPKQQTTKHQRTKNKKHILTMTPPHPTLGTHARSPRPTRLRPRLRLRPRPLLPSPMTTTVLPPPSPPPLLLLLLLLLLSLLLHPTGCDPRWINLSHLRSRSGTNLRLRRNVPIFYRGQCPAGAHPKNPLHTCYKKNSNRHSLPQNSQVAVEC
jgi:hypothetical protein